MPVDRGAHHSCSLPHCQSMQARAEADRQEIERLRLEMRAMRDRLHSMFAAAADLISAGRVQDVLARIARRAALEVRAPRHLLAVRLQDDGELQCHHRGLEQEEIDGCLRRLAAREELPPGWLAVPVRTERRDYGWLLAIHESEAGMLAEERELLEVYARYAAGALDSATALMEAERRSAQASALLELARALAQAGTSTEIACRLADSVSVVVDCDRVGVYLWDAEAGVLERRAVTQAAEGEPLQLSGVSRWAPQPGGMLERLISNPGCDPILILPSDEGTLAGMFASLGFAATLLVPLAAGGSFLGMLSVSVLEGPGRLRPNPDLLDRLCGVAAQAATALENGQLVDRMTHQAMHDQLTDLANRTRFTAELRAAVAQAERTGDRVTLVYLDLDHFKPINDEHGHATGDRLLAAVARRLRACVRAEDLVARLGGDEFAVLLSGGDPAEAEAVAARVAAVLDEPVAIDGLRVRVGISAGRASYPEDARDPDGLLRIADAAMFAAKRRRRASPARAAG